MGTLKSASRPRQWVCKSSAVASDLSTTAAWTSSPYFGSGAAKDAASATQGPFLPARDLFDFIVDELRRDPEQGPLADAARGFDPQRSGLENLDLPEGTVPDEHRGFVERVWRPVIRRRLAAAGFWRIATIGG